MSTERRNERTKARRNDETDKRDRRFLGNIQSILDSGGRSSPLNGTRTRKLKEVITPKECNSINDALQSINLSSLDVCVSLADIKSFLQKNSSNLSEDDYSKLANILCNAALEQNDIYFVLDICAELIVSQPFQTSFSTCLKDAIGKFLNEESFNSSTLPVVLAQLLVYKWPKKFNRALENSNLVLFTIFNTVIGWIGYLKEICKVSEKGAENISIDQNLFLKCIEGLVSFCFSGQKYLWLNSPELFDDIYNVCYELLICDNPSIASLIPRSLKSSLFNLCLQQKKWSQPNTPKYMNISTQTVREQNKYI
ncbi:hypothetical protein Mgra_00003613 [Meloidogyne graminicola]|uniref:DUF7627 domain-containing protein n=1 Tax=Meloidogyne graminicola TaxID=189291 RepID=A0A8S9ZUC5_9BILA|nr:hypothetical protein Mgra_00003613 [Meloidogyne graminicola]